MIIAVYIVLGLVLYGAIGGLCYVVLEGLYDDERHPSHCDGYQQASVFWPLAFIPCYLAAKAAIDRRQKELDKAEKEKILKDAGL